jgi:hypothetical protein
VRELPRVDSRTERSDYARTNLKRVISTCSSYGIVADLPAWDLDINLDSPSLRWVDRTLRGRAKVPPARWQAGIEDWASLRMSALSERDGR